MRRSFIQEISDAFRELQEAGRPLCLLGGGETVVNVVGTGRGGRNQVNIQHR